MELLKTANMFRQYPTETDSDVITTEKKYNKMSNLQ